MSATLSHMASLKVLPFTDSGSADPATYANTSIATNTTADQRFILATGMPLTTFSADRIFAALYSEKTSTPTAPTTIR